MGYNCMCAMTPPFKAGYNDIYLNGKLGMSIRFEGLALVHASRADTNGIIPVCIVQR